MYSNLGELEAHLNEVFSRDGAAVADARSILESLKGRQQLCALLKSLLGDERRLEAVAARSYSHSNNFDKFVLSDAKSPAYKVRLHIWWPDDKPVKVEHVHNHAWDFTTAIVTGGYMTQIFQRRDDGAEWHEYRYQLPKNSSEDTYWLEYLGTARLDCALDLFCAEGSTYTISRETWHRVINTQGALTSTILIQGAVVKDGSDVFDVRPIPPEILVPPALFTKAELVVKLQRYIAALESEIVAAAPFVDDARNRAGESIYV
jgi:hypothetical protein